MDIVRTLMKSIREFKKATILTPTYVTGEVIMECMIPFITAGLINGIKAGYDMKTIFFYGVILLVMAMLSLFCGVQAGNYAATASTGFARNLRKDIFYNI